MKNIFLRFRFLAVGAWIALVGFATATPVFAQAKPCVGKTALERIRCGLSTAGSGVYPDQPPELPTVVGSLISTALGLVGVLLLAYLIYGGFLWMTAGGEDAKVKKARDLIKNAIIGLVIIAVAYAITDYVLKQLAIATTGGTGG